VKLVTSLTGYQERELYLLEKELSDNYRMKIH